MVAVVVIYDPYWAFTVTSNVPASASSEAVRVKSFDGAYLEITSELKLALTPVGRPSTLR